MSSEEDGVGAGLGGPELTKTEVASAEVGEREGVAVGAGVVELRSTGVSVNRMWLKRKSTNRNMVNVMP
jgi:hypothetical protein